MFLPHLRIIFLVMVPLLWYYIFRKKKESKPRSGREKKGLETMKKYTSKSNEQRKEEISELMTMLENGVRATFETEEFKNYLTFCSRLYTYSLNNQILIMLQKPNASLCQSFTNWKKAKRFVKRGEKGLKIFAPAPYTVHGERFKKDDLGNYITDDDGNAVRETYSKKIMSYKIVHTFDVSQTDGEPLPEICKELDGKVENYQHYISAVKDFAKVPVSFEKSRKKALGWYDLKEKRIVVKEGLSELQTLKTLIHESAHAALHTLENVAQKGTHQVETEAEAVAFVVCKHFGIDTDDYSFQYLASWATGKDVPELKESLETIRSTASSFIEAIEHYEKTSSELEQSAQEKTSSAPQIVSAQEIEKITEKSSGTSKEAALILEKTGYKCTDAFAKGYAADIMARFGKSLEEYFAA